MPVWLVSVIPSYQLTDTHVHTHPLNVSFSPLPLHTLRPDNLHLDD